MFLKKTRQSRQSIPQSLQEAPRLPTYQDLESVSTVSLFSGCGGLDYGFVGGFNFFDEVFPKLPFHIVQAYDNNSDAVETYKKNIGSHIENLDLSAYPASLMPSADVLIGGFPCQDFSSCGPRRGITSERGKLYKVFTSYMNKHRPKIVVAENVPNLKRMQEGAVLKVIKDDLEAEGYRFIEWELFAPDFGVPQIRTRLFLIGIRDDLVGQPICPTGDYIFERRSINWAIQDLEDIVDETIPNQSQYFKATKAKKGNGQGDEHNRMGLPAYTIRANAKSRVHFHYRLDRRLTVRECARLQTFPDSFVFSHSATSNIKQIGNAVPPILAYYVGQAIAQYLAQSPVPKLAEQSLQEEEILSP